MCRDASIPLAFQLLSVPVCDMHIFTPTGQLRSDQPYESYREMEFTQPLPVERMRYFHDNWRVSPMLAKNFRGLAPAFVITAEMDPLRDEGEEYGRRLNEAAVKTEVHRIKGAPHIVMQLDGILEGGREYNWVVIRALKEALLK
jgi:acetyl esterase/lipase